MEKIKYDWLGEELYRLAVTLWPINRSITGAGVRETLSIIKTILPELVMNEVPSGTTVFDWKIPREWRVSDAYIVTPEGKKICSFAENNLHLVGYSIPISARVNLATLQDHLHSIPDQPRAIPYVTSYYKERWGFCLSQEQRNSLVDGDYEVFIDSELFDGALSYGELFIKGRLDKEILISTYVCHPSMANNELSGPVVATFLARWLSSRGFNKYSYRFVFVPETIGSIAYLSKNKAALMAKVIAGFNVTCVGDNRSYSFLPSRNGHTISDLVAMHVLKYIDPAYKVYQWSHRGSDERQYCSPGINLPIASIMRTKYGEYPEYHTSLDDLVSVVTPEGLNGGFNALKLAIEAIEMNCYPKVNVLCEPQLGRRGLYPTLSSRGSSSDVRLMMDLITWSDGAKSMLDIAELCQVPIWEISQIASRLAKHGLLTLCDEPSPLLENPH